MSPARLTDSKGRTVVRTLGTRSEMTRSPESSSDMTYFCTGVA